MELFTPNSKYYQKVLDSYTSSDEFIANKRVHFNNEIPPIDLYDMVHSMMRNDLWKWFLGSSYLSYDINYNEATNGSEIFDKEGMIMEASISKLMNGIRSQDYGPIPYYSHTKNGTSLINPEYHRLEINGVFLPEVDFMLHEGYRYLNVLYPDHPDFINILTTNEINDEITQAAALVHYNPNCIFFDWLATELNFELDDLDLPRAGREEATKLKIRNLKNNAFRRKLYGAKSGYWQFGSEIFQHITIHPVAEYLPFKPVIREMFARSFHVPSRHIKWFSKIYKKPDEFVDRSINKFNLLYKKLFRLIDWNNVSYDYLNEYVPPEKIWGTAYPTPYSLYDVYEYPAERNAYMSLSIQNDFYVGQKITINGNPAFINGMWSEDSYRVKVRLVYENDELVDQRSSCIQQTLHESLTKIHLDSPAYPIYIPFQVYRGTEYTLNKILEIKNEIRQENKVIKEKNKEIDNEEEHYPLLERLDLTDYENALLSTSNPLTRSIKELYKLLPDHTICNFALNPYQDGNLYLPASQFLTLYPEWLNITTNRDDIHNPYLVYGATPMSEDGFVKKEDLIINDLIYNTYVSEIVGIEPGLIKMRVEKAERLTKTQTDIIDEINNLENAKFGIIIQFDIGNDLVRNKKVVLFGKPKFDYIALEGRDDGLFQITYITFNIVAIPKIKSHNLLKALYRDYENQALHKFKNLEILFGEEDGEASEIFKKNHRKYKNITDNFENLNFIREDYQTKFKNFNDNILRLNNRFKSEIFRNVEVSDGPIRSLQTNLRSLLSSFINVSNEYITSNIGNLENVSYFCERIRVLIQNFTFNDAITNDMALLYEDLAKLDIEIKNLEKENETLGDLNQIIANAYENRKIIEQIIEKREIIILFLQEKIKLDNNFVSFISVIDSLNYNDNIFNFIEECKKQVTIIETFINEFESNFLFEQPQLFNYYNGLITLLKDKISSYDNHIIYLNETFSNIKDLITIIIDNYYLSENKQNLLKLYLEKFVKNVNDNDLLFKNVLFIEAYNNLLSIIEEYNSYYLPWLFCEIAIDLDRDYYLNLDSNRLSNEKRIALNNINRIDLILDEYLPNRGFLLNPLPSDIYMRTTDDELSSYSLLNHQDRFIGTLSISLDKFNEFLEYKIEELYGTEGVIEDYTFGSLNTASIVNNNLDIIKPSGDFFESIDTSDNSNILELSNYIKKYELEKYHYLTLNKDIIKIVDRTNNRRFSFAVAGFLELFLPYEKRNNFRGEAFVHNRIEIRGITTAGSKIIDFIDDESRFRMAALSTGDEVIGPTIENDIFIEAINNVRHFITVSEPLNVTGDFVLTFLTKMNLHAKDISKNFFRYRRELSRNELIDTGSILDHYAYGAEGSKYPFISSGFVNSVVDTSKYKEITLKHLREQSVYRRFFEQHVWDLHNFGEDSMTHYTIPSVINSSGDLFLEVGAYKTYKELNRDKQNYLTDGNGTFKFTKDREYIMKKEILDYFQDYLLELSRASDKINIGVNINAFTHSNGTISQIPDAKYSDPNIDLRFFTYGWTDQTMPYYVDIGIGKLDEFSRTGPVDAQAKTYEPRSFWNHDVYDNTYLTKYKDLKYQSEKGALSYQELKEQGIDLRKADRSLWGKKTFEINNEADVDPIYSIHRPIMRVYLGEYEVQKSITFDNHLTRRYTTVQFSVIKQVFKNLVKMNEEKLKIVNKKFFELNIFRNISLNNLRTVDENGDDLHVIVEGQYLNFKYEGVWVPRAQFYENRNQYYIQYPPPPTDANNIYYYSIAERIQLVAVIDDQNYGENSDIYETTERTFETGTIIVYEDEKWVVKDFIFSGVYGDQVALENIMVKPEGEEARAIIANAYPVSNNDGFFTNPKITTNNDGIEVSTIVEELTLKHRLLLKLLINLGLFTGSIARTQCYSVKELLSIYNTIFTHKEDLEIITEKLKEEILLRVREELELEAPDLTEEEFEEEIIKRFEIEIAKEEFDLEIQRRFREKVLGTDYNINDTQIVMFPRSFSNEFTNVISKNNVYWFNYAFGFDLLHDCLITPGQNIALIYLENDFKIILLNENKFTFLIDSARKIRINEYEYFFFIGKYGYTSYQSGNNLITKDIFLFEKIEKYTNVIDLKYKNLLKGSVDIKVAVIPHFTVEGYPYDENNELKYDENNNLVEDIYDITQDNIYYDNFNDKLYSFNTIHNERIKFAIKQEDNLYFKNLLFIYGQYQKLGATVGGQFVNQGVITPITGIRFDADTASLFDRILELEQINIRSQFNVNLESTLFSSYCNIEGIMKGIYIKDRNAIDDTDVYISVNYRDDREPIITSNKLRFSTEIQKLMPVRTYNNVTQNFPESIIDFADAKWPDEQKIYPPIIQWVDVTKSISTDTDSMAFKYFKNMLVLEGEINIYQPNTINFGKNTKLADSLNNVKISDVINSIVGISNVNTTSYNNYTLTNSSFNIKFIDFNKNIMIFVADNAIGLKYVKSLQGLEKEVELDVQFAVPNFTTGTTVDSLTWDENIDKWVISVSNPNGTSEMYSITVSSENNLTITHSDYFIEEIYNEKGIDINTYQFVTIKDKDFGDNRWDNHKTVLARDVSFISVPIRDVQKETFFAPENFSTSSNLQLSNSLGNPLGWPGLRISGNSGVIQSRTRINVPANDYKVLSFSVKKLEGTAGALMSANSISIGIQTPSFNTPADIDQIWVYDKVIQRWVVTDNTQDFYNFISNYNSTEIANVVTYLVGHEFGRYYDVTNRDSIFGGQFLWRLPRPDVNENIIVAAVVCRQNITNVTLEITVNNDGTTGIGQFDILNMFVSTKKEVITHNRTITKQIFGGFPQEGISEENFPGTITEAAPFFIGERPANDIYNDNIYEEGPYNPLIRSDDTSIEYLYEKFRARRWVDYNIFDNQVIIIGSTIFFYTPTNYYSPIANGEEHLNLDLITSEGRDVLVPTGVTEENHWKRAELPSVFNGTYQLFNEMTLDEAYTLVNDQRDITLAQITAIANAAREGMDADSQNAISIVYKAISDWITAHPVQYYPTDELCPIDIIENDITFIYNEKGKIPRFFENNSGYHEKWRSSQEVKFELGLTTSVYLTRQNYLRYLADYFSVICGAQRYIYYFEPGGIKDVKLTNAQLIIQNIYDDIISFPLNKATCRDEIENYNNWHISNMAPEYVFNSTETSFETRTVMVGNDTFTIDSFPVQKPRKAFEIMGKYINNNVQIYAGYVMANEDVLNVYNKFGAQGPNPDWSQLEHIIRLFPNRIKLNGEFNNPSTSFIVFGKKYPAIFYSDNNGQSFNQVRIPTNAITKSSHDYENNASADPPDIWCDSVYKIGNKINVIYKSPSSSASANILGYTTFTINEQETNSLMAFDGENFIYTATDLENITINNLANSWKNFNINFLNGVLVARDHVFPHYIANPGHRFLLEDQYNLMPLSGEQRIIEIGDDFIRYTNAVDPADNEEILRVLVSIDQTELIENPTIYLDYKEEYLDSNGYLLVNHIKEVDDPTQANRLYSPREAMVLRHPSDADLSNVYQREVLPIRGIPAISEDAGRSIYRYHDPIVDSKGNEIYKYIEAINFNNQTIYLCQANGNYLVFRDSSSNHNYFTLETLIKENIDYQTLVPAPVLVPGFKAEEHDIFGDLLNDLDNKQIQFLDFDGSNPKLFISLPDIKTVIDYLVSEEDDEKRLLYKWAYNSDPSWVGTPVGYVLDINKVDDEGRTQSFILNPFRIGEDFIRAVDSVEQFEGPFGPIYGKRLSSRFAPFRWKDEYYVYDLVTSTLLLKENNNFYMNISMPYQFANGQISYDNITFEWANHKRRSDDTEFEYIEPIEDLQQFNGIYIKPRGYGGSMHNENFIYERPELIDYRAFERKLVENKFEEYIYLNDRNGNKYNSKNGLFWLSTNNDVKINYNNLINKVNKVKFYPDAIGYEGNETHPDGLYTEYNVFKLEQAPIEVYTPKNTIWFNSPTIRQPVTTQSDSGPEILHSSGRHQILLTLFRIIKAGLTVNESLISEYEIEIRDYRNRPIRLPEGTSIIYENGRLLFLYDDTFIYSEENLPVFDHDLIRVFIKDENGQTFNYDLNVAPKEETEIGKILNINRIEFDKEELYHLNTITINFDGRSLKFRDNNEPSYFISIDYTTREFIRWENNANQLLDFEVQLIAIDYEQATRFMTINSHYEFKLDVRNFHLELLLNRSWATTISNLNEVQCRIYSKDQLVYNPNSTTNYLTGQLHFEFDRQRIRFVSNYVNLIESIKVINEIFVDNINLEKWVYVVDQNGEYEFKHTSLIIVDGLYGNILLNKPAYRNFRDLVDKLDNIIEYKERRIIETFNGRVFNEIVSIAPNFSNMKLGNLINYDKVDLNTGDIFFIKMKLLPLNTIYPQLKTLNHPDYIYPVSTVEARLYGFDRIFINENSYVPPPITINNIMYNSESLPLYYTNNWLNKDGFMIYLADNEGRFTRPTVRNRRVEFDVLGNELGDCRADIYGNIDPRFNPLEPLYKSSIDWFKSEFYIEGKEINPFIVNINIKDVYDEKLKDFVPSVNLTSPTKFGNDFIQQEVSKSYLTKVDNSLLYRYCRIEDDLIQNSKLDIIEHNNGLINLIVQGPYDTYQFEQHKFLFGIKYFNTFSSIGPYRSIWTSTVELENKIDLSFYLNTRENILDKNNRDFGVVDITEMGLFNQRGELVAYMTHPIAQYRSDTQHISYNLIVEEVGA